MFKKISITIFLILIIGFLSYLAIEKNNFVVYLCYYIILSIWVIPIFSIFKKIKKIKEPGISVLSIIGPSVGLLTYIIMNDIISLSLVKPIVLFHICMCIGISFAWMIGIQIEFEKKA